MKLKVLLTLALVIFGYTITLAQKPKNGKYIYAIAFAEWGGKSMKATCTVIIKGDSIRIINNGSAYIKQKKGATLERGIMIKHIPTGKWIIGHDPKDKNAEEVGGCTGGPAVIDFKKKKFWVC